MTCASSIDDLIHALQAILTNHPDSCCTEYLTPSDVSALVSSIQTTCADACSVSSPNDTNVYCVHNFDIPVHTLCAYLFRDNNTDISTIPTSCLWKSAFENTNTTPPQIDTLSSTSQQEYYILYAWSTMFTHYIQMAQTINTYDIDNLNNAHLMLTDESQLLNDDMDMLHAEQCYEDTLQDAVDNPQEAWECVREQTQNDVRERMQNNRAKRKRRSESSGTKRCKKKLFVPLGRKKMGYFDHAMVDTRFEQNERDLNERIRNTRDNQVVLEERKALAQTIQKTLRQLKHIFHNINTLLLQFINEWDTNKLVRNTKTLPLTRRMVFQQQLKSSLFNAKALMKQQVFQYKWQLCEDVPNGQYDYYAYFNYSIQSCLSVRELPKIDIVLNASNSLLFYTQQQIVLQLLQNATYLETNHVITREQILYLIGQLRKTGSIIKLVQ